VAMKVSNPLSVYSDIFKRFTVPHDTYKLIRNELELCLARVGRSRFPRCLHIIGETRAGKTFLIENFLLRHSEARRKDGLMACVVYACIPAGGSAEGLCEALLFKLGDEYAHRGSLRTKTARLIRLLQKVGCRMVILDNFQHLCDKGQNARLFMTSDWLKDLVDTNEWALVCVGLPESEAVIRRNEQLIGRFDATLELGRFDWNNNDSALAFRGVLRSFSKSLKPFVFPDLGSQEMALRFYFATGGLIGLVSRILERAVQDAIDANATTISLESLQAAFSRAIWFANKLPKNMQPFQGKVLPNSISSRTSAAVNLTRRIDDKDGESVIISGLMHPQRVGTQKPGEGGRTKAAHHEEIKGALAC
jgi:hypothetical protein